MSILKSLRESQNLTQEELSEKSGVSVRTIQRIESGQEPKGYTLRVLAKTLGVTERELLNKPSETKAQEDYNENKIVYEKPVYTNLSLVKLINLSSLPFVVLPPLNIVIPLLLMFTLKVKNPVAKQIISLQIMWTIVAPIVFMLVVFLKLGNKSVLAAMILLVLVNVYIVLRNAVDIDKNKKLYYSLTFNMI